MPTTVVDDPLGISCVFSDGRSAEFDLSDLPNPRLTRDLATALVELIHPHGSADSRSTVDGYVAALRAMVRALAEQGFTGGADGLRRGQLAQSWMAGPTRLEALTRGLVEGYARSGGVPVAMNPRVADLAHAVAPVTASALDPDLAGRARRRPARPDKFEESALGRRLTSRLRGLADESFRHQQTPRASMRHPARLRGLVDRPGRREHRHDPPTIDLPRHRPRRPDRTARRAQDRIAPPPRNPQRGGGILDRHARIDQPRQPITKSNTVLRKRHDRRNLSNRECCDDRVNPPGVLGAFLSAREKKPYQLVHY